MTYIIAGNFNKKNFLMVDSIADRDKDGLFFSEKLFKLESSNIYTTLSGSGVLMTYLRLYDEWMTYANTTPNYESTATIQDVIKHIPQGTVLVPTQRLYFLTQTKVFYYDLDFKNGKRNVSTPVVIPQDNYTICHQNYFTPITDNPSDLYVYSTQKIIDYNQTCAIEGTSIIYNFKNRFGFVQCGEKYEHKRPQIDLTEFIVSEFGNTKWNTVSVKP